MAKVAHVKDIREHAKSASLQAVAGASALSIVSSARSLADAGFSLEHDGDLSGALYKYSQAANLLEHVLGTAEYKRETPKGQRGVLYQQTAKLSEYITGQMLPRAKKIEERLKEIEHTQPTPEPDARPMGSVADRMKMLAQAGMDVRGAAPPKPAKPLKLHDPRPPPDLKPKSDAIDLGPAPLNPTSPGGGASSIQHDLGFLNDLDARPNGKMPPLVPSAPVRPPGMFPASSSNSPIGMFGITPSAPPARSRGGSNTSATSTTTATMTVTQPSAPPRSPRSMSLHITSPTLTTNNLGALAPSPSLAPNQEQPSPTKSPRPPVPPRLTPTSTGNAPRSIAGDRTPPTRSSTLGTSTPPLSKSALWSSPQHTGTSINGIGIVTNGTGGRSQPLSPLATGGDSLGLGLGLRTDLGELREDDERPAKPQRSATTEAFETAYPSIDAIEANFPSIDSLEASFPSVGTMESSFPSVESMEATDAELKLLKASVPSNVPGTMPALTGPTSPPSVGFEFGRTFSGKDSISPTPRSFPNAIPDLDGPRPASTPANGRPGVTFGSAAKTPQRTPDPPKLDKLPKPDLPITNVVNAQKLKSYLGTALQILVLDVRPREDFEARRMPVDNLVCIEPILLTRKGMSTKELQEALVLSSKTERTLFERRNTFDLVVLCDEGSTSFGDPSTPLGVLFRIIYETEFLKPLRRSPVFLYGGIRAWGNDVGEFVGSQAKEDVVVAQSPDASKRLSRKPAVSNRPASNSVSHARMPQDAGLSGSSFARTPIAYPERAVSPPSSGTPTQSHRPIEDMMSPPPPLTAGYFEPPHHAYSGSVTLSTTRPASIDYPNLIRPPPIAAAPTMERVDSRPRMQPPKPPQFQPDYQVVYWRDEQLGMSGLRNMGNTCYMNSVLQCLSATVPFTRFFTDRRWHHEVNMMNPLGTRGELAGAFYNLLRDMWQGELPYLTPIPFRKSICQHARQFAGTEQHDAQEFLIFLLDGIHEDLNRIIVKPQFEELTAQREAELEAMPKQLAGAYEWARYRRRNDSIVVDYFQGQFCNRMQCLTCGQTSTTYNAFLNLSVPIPVSKGTSKVSLTDCINALVNKEVMDNADAWHCPRCKTARRAAKQLTFSRMPPMLIIHLKRFSFKGPFTDKLETLVEFPLKDLDLTAYMPPPLTPNMDKDGLEKYAPTDPRAQIPPYRYELYGVTNHFGSLSSGHYTAFVKSRGKWMYCDDSRITPADTKEVVGKPAYILFYKRVPSGQ